MVAITVILAAVIGTVVLDLGQNVGNTGPTASITVTDASATLADGNQFVVIEHRSGEDLEANNLRIRVRFDSNQTLIDTWEGGDWQIDNDDYFQSGLGAADDKIQLNGNTLTTEDTISTGDVITWEVQDKSGGTAPALESGEKYSFTIIDTDTDNTVASVVVRIR